MSFYAFNNSCCIHAYHLVDEEVTKHMFHENRVTQAILQQWMASKIS